MKDHILKRLTNTFVERDCERDCATWLRALSQWGTQSIESVRHTDIRNPWTRSPRYTNTSQISNQFQFNATNNSIPIQFQFNSNSIPIQFFHQFQFNSNSIQPTIQFQFSLNFNSIPIHQTIPIQFPFNSSINSNSIPIQFKVGCVGLRWDGDAITERDEERCDGLIMAKRRALRCPFRCSSLVEFLGSINRFSILNQKKNKVFN